MANYPVLKAALNLLATRSPEGAEEGAETDQFRVEKLSSQERRELNAQLESRDAWALGRKQNVVALGISENREGAGSTGELALTVYVKKKYPLSYLNEPATIPPRMELTGLGEPIPTDVREIGDLRLEALTVEKRPIVCGYSIGRGEKGSTGTLGCMVRKRGDEDGKRLLLSNSHVLAKSGFGEPGDLIHQPGPDDVELVSEPVAKLLTWQPFKVGDTYENHTDAAVAEPVNSNLFDPTIYDIGQPKGVRPAERGMMVQKSGRTSGHTWGQIDDVDFTASVPYSDPDSKGFRVNFSDLVLCSRYTEPGDSGALVLDMDGYAVGLHFCGTSTVSVACPIQYVLDDLNVDLVT